MIVRNIFNFPRFDFAKEIGPYTISIKRANKTPTGNFITPETIKIPNFRTFVKICLSMKEIAIAFHY